MLAGIPQTPIVSVILLIFLSAPLLVADILIFTPSVKNSIKHGKVDIEN